MGWFQRNTEGIKTKSDEKKEMPEGAWYKCPSCKTVVSSQEHENSHWVCSHVVIMRELVLLNISAFYLMEESIERLLLN